MFPLQVSNFELSSPNSLRVQYVPGWNRSQFPPALGWAATEGGGANAQ